MSDMTVSNSEIFTWLRCRRKWFIEYYLALQPAMQSPVSSSALGTKIHTALEGHYGYGIEPDLSLRILYAAEIQENPGWESELLAEQDLGLAMVMGYLDWLDETGEDAGLSVTAVEHEVNVPLPALPGVSLRCKLDQVGQDGDTQYFMDYKTGQNFEREEALALDQQMKIYQVAQHLETSKTGAAGTDALIVGGGMITTLRRVKRTAKAQPPFYSRSRFRYNPDQARATYLKIVSVAGEIMGARAALDEIYARGGNLAEVNQLQLGLLRPTPIPDRCKWDCPLAGGLCVAMDDGSDWAGILTSSGRFVQADPYAHYADTAIKTIQDQVTKIEAQK